MATLSQRIFCLNNLALCSRDLALSALLFNFFYFFHALAQSAPSVIERFWVSVSRDFTVLFVVTPESILFAFFFPVSNCLNISLVVLSQSICSSFRVSLSFIDKSEPVKDQIFLDILMSQCGVVEVQMQQAKWLKDHPKEILKWKLLIGGGDHCSLFLIASFRLLAHGIAFQ